MKRPLVTLLATRPADPADADPSGPPGPPGPPPQIVVDSPKTAERVIDDVMSGRSVDLWIDLDPLPASTFLDELSRVADVRDAPVVDLDDDQSALLDLLSRGATLGEAGRDLGLSRRSADRRMAAARRVLGVDTTAEAIIEWSRRSTAS